MIESVLIAGQKPSDVLQRGTQVVGNLPGDNTEPERNAAFGVELGEFLSGLLFVVTETTFGAFAQKGDDLGIEVLDSLRRPVLVFRGPRPIVLGLEVWE